LKKSVRPNSLVIDWLKRLFCTRLREIRVRKPLPKVKISISDAYFSAAQTMVDFFNRIGQLQTFTGNSDELLVGDMRVGKAKTGEEAEFTGCK
jgi:hypothetical protein